MSLLVLVIVFQVAPLPVAVGPAVRAVGEHPRAAETVGIDVVRLRYRNVIARRRPSPALGGAFLSLEATGSFHAGHDRGSRASSGSRQ